jgi:predicted metalloprotease with PDZ domain
MNSPRLGRRVLAALSAIGVLAAPRVPAVPLKLQVDATDVSRKLLHARLEVPAQPGPLTLVYPKWIPGEHMPSGPITELVDLKASAGGRPVDWRRDDVDMYAFHLEVPGGASRVELSFDFILASGNGNYSEGVSVTPELLDLSWNDVVLYPEGARADSVEIVPSLRLPKGWEFGTALPVAKHSGNQLHFQPATLERLIDSPVIAGRFFRQIPLTPGQEPPHFLDMVADSEAALAITPGDIGHFQQLVAETGALFGSRHYHDYHFLLTLSDHVQHFGLEHNESSDNRAGENSLINQNARDLFAGLLPHEMVHSWNGKYRRPAGLATPDYQQPMKDDLLWVYEGLTTYLGNILTARSGLWTDDQLRQQVALFAATLDTQAGRKWRSLADTTDAAQLLYTAPHQAVSRRRSVDFYPEGLLIWLEADTVIRQQTHGASSLDDFCRRFYGGPSGTPKVVPYTLDDLVAALNQTCAYDWRGFFQKRVYQIAPRAPLGGIENAGWRLAYTNKPTKLFQEAEALRKTTNLRFSLGLTLDKDGNVADVLPGSPADRAGLAPGLKLVAVNSRKETPDLLHAAVAASVTNSAPIGLLCENDDYFQTFEVDYHGGEKYPCLVREPDKPDLLKAILHPRAGAAQAAAK